MRYLRDSLTHLRCRLAYLVSRVWWFLRRPATRSMGVALWDRGQILLVRTGERSALALPGGDYYFTLYAAGIWGGILPDNITIVLARVAR